MKEKLELDLAIDQLNIETLFGKEILEQIQQIISDATGLAFVTIDYKGEPVTELTSFTPFCQRLRKNKSNERLCRSSDAFGSISSAVTQKPFVYLCPCGLMEVAIPLIVKDHYLGGFIGGQVRGSHLPKHITKLEMIYNPTQSEENLLEMQALYELIPKMSYEKFIIIVDFISIIIGHLGEREVLRFQDKEVFSNHRLIEQIEVSFQMPTTHFKELVKAMDRNDFPAIYTLIPKLTKEIYSFYQEDVIYLLLKELQKQFIRSVSGVDINSFFEDIKEFDSMSQEMKQMMTNIVRTIYLDDNLDDTIFSLKSLDVNASITVEYWLFQIVDYLLKQQVMKSSKKVQRVFLFIDKHINENMGLSEITRECEVSQGYISRIFRQHLNTSVMNYLHMRKIYLAKVYFCLTEQSMTEVTFQLGYNEVSYFAKVFKKYEGMTINEYKRCQSTFKK